MSYRILTKNAVENTNIDGARDHNFNAGRRSGIVKDALNGGNFFASNNNTIALDTCELRLCGHRIVLDAVEYKTLLNIPSVPIRYSMIAQVIVDDNNDVSFDLIIQSSSTPLVQENLDTTGKGKFQLEIGRFTQLTDGTITDVVRTADLITGGAGGGDSEYIRIGTVTTNKISPELDADVDIENTINPDDNKPQTNFTFNLPTPSGTVVSLNGVEKTSINTDTTPTANSENLITSGGVHDYPAILFAESERQKNETDGAIVHEKQLSKITTLWTNPNPSNDFSSQTITLANDNYDYAIMLCASRANALDIQVSFLFEKGATPILNYVLTNADAAYSVENMCRRVYRTNNTTLNIQDCYYSLKSNAATVSNSLLIPYKVIGIKMGE